MGALDGAEFAPGCGRGGGSAAVRVDGAVAWTSRASGAGLFRGISWGC